MRITPLSMITALLNNTKNTLARLKKDTTFLEEDLLEIGADAHAVLNKGLRVSAKALYGYKTRAYNDYWGNQEPELVTAQKMLSNLQDVPSLERFVSQLEKLAKIISTKQALYKDQETVEKRVFDHNGYRVEAYNLSPVTAEAMLEPLDVVSHLFEKRGVEVLLHEALGKVVLRSDPEHKIEGGWGTSSAFYQSDGKIVFLHDTILDVSCEIDGIKGIVYGFVHEVGHWLHFDFLTRDAYDYWNKSWAGVIPEGMDYLTYEQAVANDYLKELGVPTNYGRRDPFEDFAETFAFFILNPKKLTDRACERMKETLRMSMGGGRLFMRVAHHSPHL